MSRRRRSPYLPTDDQDERLFRALAATWTGAVERSGDATAERGLARLAGVIVRAMREDCGESW